MRTLDRNIWTFNFNAVAICVIPLIGYAQILIESQTK